MLKDMDCADDWDEKFEARVLKKKIEEIIEALNEHHRNVNIARVTGSSVAIATGGTAAGLAIAAPFTLGLTLIPAIVLGVASGVSGAVSVGASITEHFIKKHNVKEVQVKWDNFRLNFLRWHKIIALPLDFMDMVSAAHSLNTKEKSPASKSFQEIISFLDKVIKGEFD